MAVGLLQDRLFLETIYAFIIVVSSLAIYFRSRKLHKISSHKGIGYFSKAFLNFAISLFSRYVLILIESLGELSNTSPIHLIFVFIITFTASLGGFYLAYSLVWRSFEGKSLVSLIYVGALVVGVAENLIAISRNIDTPYLMLNVQIVVLLLALIDSYAKRKGAMDYGFYAVIISLSIFILIFLGELLDNVFPFFSAYTFGIVAVLFLIMLKHVIKITK